MSLSRTPGNTTIPVLQNLPFYAEAENAFGSCFSEGSFTPAQRLAPALPSPQAFRLSGELPASFSRFFAALRSRSITSPHAGFWQRKVRSESVNCSSTQPHRQHVLEEVNQRS